MALCGCLLQAGFSCQETSHFVESIAACAGDEEAKKRAKVAKLTEERISNGELTRGWPTLKDTFGETVIDRLREWLGLWKDDHRQTTGECSFTAQELMKMELPPISWMVPGYLPKGLAILGGRPKAGKSMFGLHLAVETALGGTFIGAKPVDSRPVLYVALEDGKRRLFDRLTMALHGRESPNDLRFLLSLPRLDDDGISTLEQELEKQPKPELVIIDTLGQVTTEAKRGANAYLYDYSKLAMLQRFAMENDICLVLIHHLRKPAPGSPGASDIMNEFSGTTGITTAADTLWAFVRRPTGHVELHMTGRDIESEELHILVDYRKGSWTLAEDVDETLKGFSPEREKIIHALREADRPLRPQEVAQACSARHDATRKLLRSIDLPPLTGSRS